MLNLGEHVWDFCISLNPYISFIYCISSFFNFFFIIYNNQIFLSSMFTYFEYFHTNMNFITINLNIFFFFSKNINIPRKISQIWKLNRSFQVFTVFMTIASNNIFISSIFFLSISLLNFTFFTFSFTKLSSHLNFVHLILRFSG